MKTCTENTNLSCSLVRHLGLHFVHQLLEYGAFQNMLQMNLHVLHLKFGIGLEIE